MTDLRAAAQQALEALEDRNDPQGMKALPAMTALRAALAEPVQEPVAWVRPSIAPDHYAPVTHWSALPPAPLTPEQARAAGWFAVVRADAPPQRPVEPVAWEQFHEHMAGPFYTAPQQRSPLSDEEIDRVTDQQWANIDHKPIYAAHRAYARAIEAAHGIKEKT